MKFEIETERLILRDMREADLEGMFELDSDPRVHKYLGNRPFTNKASSLAVIRGVINQYHERGIGRWVAIEKESGDFIGWSGLRLNIEFNMNGFTKYYDLGYRLIPRYWGKGYATESGKAALAYAFKTMKLKRLYATTHIDNQASHQALLKIGLNYINTFYFEREHMDLRWYKIENK
ncbi:GNAT family N-acetyltransferase [Cognatitamlana onchidii]|uniref:GNAT family N-acetyltransferase n=1 Tax=Cognatitamlana onchidii TaxID=2562860 RepID=UPI0010A66865|nr:GNAT family N-acetyltransferase [Algibacter onchidii]